MKRPTMLVRALLQQAALDLDLSVERDVERVQRRCKHEGLSFLTITLPTLSDALERGLEAGSFSCPTSFSRHGSLPRFLGGFFKRVFTMDGRLLPDPCAECIYYIRQICRFFKKLKIPCSARRNADAIRHFLEVEGELRQMTHSIERKDNFLDKISGILWSQVFPEPDYGRFVCHHGPGVTADRYRSNERFQIRKWNTRSEYTFPSDLHCYPNFGSAAEHSGIDSIYRAENRGEGTVRNEGIKYLDLRDEEPVRVVFVPKTQTAPRVIAIEPSHVQYMQQSIKDYMYETLESHCLTKNSIHFVDQSLNQRLAYRSSIDKRLATLDLKDASDRVHLHLVQRIFKTSGLLEYLEDARSLHATLPDGTNIVLSKYASMGSALCFPVEACVFYTLIQSAMHILDGRRPSSQSIRRYSRMIDVYGDDLIVPVAYTDIVVSYLESYGLKVNINKSFSKSYFRESCGADYYKGVSVKPIYARQVPHDDSRDWGPSEVMSWVATANQFYMNGQWLIASFLHTMVRQVVRRTIPRAREPGHGLVFLSMLYTTNLHWNADLQCYKQKRLVYSPIKRKDHIDGNELACLNKWGLSSVLRNRKSVIESTYNSYRRNGAAAAMADRSSIVEELDRDLIRHSVRRMGSEEPLADAQFRNGSVCCLSLSSCYAPAYADVIYDLGADSSADLRGTGFRSGGNTESDTSLTECLSDPLSYLTDNSEGLNFTTSTKRGCFKSNSRWVSLHS